MNRTYPRPPRFAIQALGLSWYCARCWPLALVLLLYSGALPAAPRIESLAVLPDPGGNMSLAQVMAAEQDFQPLAQNSFAGGYTRSVHWMRIRLETTGDGDLQEVLPPFLDDLRLYLPDPQQPGQFLVRQQGDTLPFVERELNYRGFVFRLAPLDSGSHTLYLCLQTTSSSLMLLRVWTTEDFFSQVQWEYGLLFASIAILLAVILLNINAWFWLRDPLNLWFLSYLSALIVQFASNTGLLQQFVFTQSTSANNVLVGLTALLSMALVNLFYRQLFHIDARQPWLNRIYLGVFGITLLGIIPGLAGYYPETMHILTATVLPMTLLGIVLSLRLWRQRIPGGGMMLLANLTSMIGMTTYILYLRGYFSGDFVMLHSLQIASLGSTLALHLAVGARYRAIDDARQVAEQRASSEHEMRERQGHFLSMLTHELRTALSVLKLAINHQPMSERAVERAGRAIEGMSLVIERSIEAQRLADGRLEVATAPCDLAELLRNVTLGCPDPQRVQLQLDAPATLVTDEKLLRVVLANLLDNAVKYGAPRQPVQLRLHATIPPRVEVCNALGSAGAPDPAQIFNKYYRAPLAYGFTGSGQGLYIAKTLSEILGIELCCHLGQGQICFTLQM